MENIYGEYYKNQAGSGLASFKGHRYHNGRGLGGKILKWLKPALKYIGRQGWDAINSFGRDVMSGETLSSASRNTLIKTTQSVLNDANSQLEEYKKQKGRGIKRKRSVKKKVCKRRKTIKKVYKAKPKRKKTTKRKPKKKLNFL